MASSCTREDLDWILGKILQQNDCQVLEQAFQGSGQVTITGGI